MPELIDYFTTYTSPNGKLFYKNGPYAYVYEEVLSRFRGKDVVLMEVGVGKGGCVDVWKWYLGDKAKIYGVDYCLAKENTYEADQITFLVADQRDRASLEALPVPEIDILIDDASHNSPETINTFEVLWPRIKSNGVYIIEDVYTSYRASYGGGYKNPNSFIEYCKNIMDSIHYLEDAETIPHNNLWAVVKSLTITDGMIIIRKR